jgi:hypothetical protein
VSSTLTCLHSAPVLFGLFTILEIKTKSVISEIKQFPGGHHHHHISVMELGNLLTRSGLTYPEVSAKVCHDSFCQLGISVLLPWVIFYGAFYLHVVHSRRYTHLNPLHARAYFSGA